MTNPRRQRPGSVEERLQRRVPTQGAAPLLFWIRPRRSVLGVQDQSSAHPAVIEAQNVHPPLVEEMMGRRPVLREGVPGPIDRYGIRELPDSVEMTVEQLAGERDGVGSRRKPQRPRKRPTAARRVDYELGLDLQFFAFAPTGQADTVWLHRRSD